MTKVLIIEDTAAKADAVCNELNLNLGGDGDLSLDRVASLSEAVLAFQAISYDLIILDLMLPYVPGGTADKGAGLELLRLLRRPNCASKDSIVVALSAFPNEVQAARDKFDRLAIMILNYNVAETWKEALSSICRDVRRITASNAKVDFVIFVALEEEYEALTSAGLRLGSHGIVSGLSVQHVSLGDAEPWTGVIVRLRRMGLVTATLDASMAIPIFEPRVVAMCGICAGLSEEVEMGQVVVASPAWEYQAGKWAKDGFLIEPYQVSLRPSTRVIAEKMIGRTAYIADCEGRAGHFKSRPPLQVRPIIAAGVTGSAVIADKGRLEHIAKQHRKVSVIDMETYGIYAAAFEAGVSVDHYFSVKCVVDFADADKGDDLHPYGSAISALVAVDLIREVLLAERGS